jgi:predicted O-methyltransferase YrrM
VRCLADLNAIRGPRERAGAVAEALRSLPDRPGQGRTEHPDLSDLRDGLEQLLELAAVACTRQGAGVVQVGELIGRSAFWVATVRRKHGVRGARPHMDRDENRVVGRQSPWRVTLDL